MEDPPPQSTLICKECQLILFLLVNGRHRDLTKTGFYNAGKKRPECKVHIFQFLLSAGWFQLVQVKRNKIALNRKSSLMLENYKRKSWISYQSKQSPPVFWKKRITSRHPVRRISRTPSEKSLSKEVTGQPREERCTLANFTRDCKQKRYRTNWLPALKKEWCCRMESWNSDMCHLFDKV